MKKKFNIELEFDIYDNGILCDSCPLFQSESDPFSPDKLIYCMGSKQEIHIPWKYDMELFNLELNIANDILLSQCKLKEII